MVIQVYAIYTTEAVRWIYAIHIKIYQVRQYWTRGLTTQAGTQKKKTFSLAFKIFICILAATSIKEFTVLYNKGCVSRTCKTESLNYIDVTIST